jgi:mitotic spindle assembly checkpoint protein MAD2B
VKNGLSRSVEGAMATAALGQYFRSFMVKLGMIESQLAELPRDGLQSPPCLGIL